MIKSMVRNERPVITTRDDLLSALTAAYEKLRDESFRQFFINLCNSMPKRLEAVRQAEGRHTKYKIYIIIYYYLIFLKFIIFIIISHNMNFLPDSSD
jgi:hypothetical protein